MRRHRYRPRRFRSELPPIHVWVEQIDEHVGAVIAHCEAVHHGGYYAASTFLLMDAALLPPRNWMRHWENAGRSHLGKYLAEHNGSTLPFVRPIRSDPRETSDE